MIYDDGEDEELEMEYQPTNREKRKVLRKMRFYGNYEMQFIEEGSRDPILDRKNGKKRFKKE